MCVVADEMEREGGGALAAVWWGAGAALVAAVLAGAALLHVALRHRRLARSFMRFTAHTPRYDTRRGHATITDHGNHPHPHYHIHYENGHDFKSLQCTY